MLPSQPSRQVVNVDALPWLAANPAPAGASVVTSLPDVSELTSLSLEAWKRWFVDTSALLLRWIPDDGVAIFFQSDIRHAPSAQTWVDKGYLVQRAAEDVGAFLWWHKIVCRKTPGTVTPGRPSYSHMLCFGRRPPGLLTKPGPDVLADAGPQTWSRGMGEAACRAAVRFLKDETPTTLVVDPFCGEGALLAVANAMGLSALGLDRSRRRCGVAANLRCEEVM